MAHTASITMSSGENVSTGALVLNSNRSEISWQAPPRFGYGCFQPWARHIQGPRHGQAMAQVLVLPVSRRFHYSCPRVVRHARPLRPGAARRHTGAALGKEAGDARMRDGRLALGVPGDATADQMVQAAGPHVLPGLIDPHLHLRNPGYPSIETISTSTRAALLHG